MPKTSQLMPDQFSSSGPIWAICGPFRSAVRRRRAFTLVELTVSLALMSIVLTALGSVIAVALKAAPTAKSFVDAQWQTTLETITTDLRDAVRVTAASSRYVEFEVPDRDADSVNEVIRYEWSGVANTPIIRTYKGNGGNAIGGNVSSFNLIFTTTTRSRTVATAASEGAEQLLAAYTAVGSGSVLVRTNMYPSQIFTPSLPANATSWRLTRLRFVARNGTGLLGTIGVQVRDVDPSTGFPSSTVYDEQAILQTLLTSTNTWYSLNYNVPGLSPTAPAAIVWRSTLGTSPMTIPVATSGVPDNGAFYATFATSSSSWGGLNDGSMTYEVYGKVTAPGATTNSVIMIESVRVSLTPSGGSAISSVVSMPLGAEY